MHKIFTYISLLILLGSCTSVKNIYTDENITDKQFEKLSKNFINEPGDTANANKLVYAYQFLLHNYQSRIDRLKQSSDLKSKERLLTAYDDLQAFYATADVHPGVRDLLKPGNVATERETALVDAAEGWYNYAETLLNRNSWQNGREAYSVLKKVDKWLFNYRDTQNLLAEAWEMGTVDAVIQPLRNEGFYNRYGFMNHDERFSTQLVNDLSSWSNNEMYRIYSANERWNNKVEPDWIIEPVITRMQINPVRYVKTNRTVTKQIEVGKDSAKSPLYKTIKAVLHITEASVLASGEMEARISDVQSNRAIGSNRFTESYVIREVTARYTGDKEALSSEDWRLVNNRNAIRVDEFLLREMILEKIYPDLLRYLRNQLRPY